MALGGAGKVSIKFGNFGKGFVHVFDEISFLSVMKELDTITDFVHYLIAKEDLYSSGVKTLFHGGEEDLLAFYVHHGREFPKTYDCIVIDADLWSGFNALQPEYKAKKIADRDSYIWDRLLRILSDDILHGNIEFGPDLNEAELAIRTMAREDRFSRRMLGKSFIEFLNSPDKVKSGLELL